MGAEDNVGPKGSHHIGDPGHAALRSDDHGRE
jgi:hypothetical protein